MSIFSYWWNAWLNNRLCIIQHLGRYIIILSHLPVIADLLCRQTLPGHMTWWQSGRQCQLVWSLRAWVARVPALALAGLSWVEEAGLYWGIHPHWTWGSGSCQSAGLCNTVTLTSLVWWEHLASSPAHALAFVTRNRKRPLEVWRVWSTEYGTLYIHLNLVVSCHGVT